MKPGNMFAAGLLLFAGCQTVRQPVGELVGFAENLWGERINLAELNDGTVVLHPFSPSD